jgi:capsule biosynthesis phosphatase
MNIIIPIGGAGERFSNEGYHLPKPLIYSRGKPMIYWMLESLNIQKNDTVVVAYTFHLDLYRFKDLLLKKIPNILFVSIPYQTNSVIQTLFYTINNIKSSVLFKNKIDWTKRIVTMDCDTFYTSDILSKIRSVTYDNCILYKTDKNIKPIYSYILLDESDKILSIKEKEKISNNANIGVYIFKDLHLLNEYISVILKENNKNERYISHIYDKMISQHDVYGVKFEDVCCIGTPMQLKIFGSIKSTENDQIRFCFDLDNTLVSFPVIENDYTSVLPIPENINFLKFVHSLGHTIIIHTARRMKTHKGNSGKVLADIGKITFDTLEKFNIPYDEIYFGKPEADFYIDDKAINCHQNLERETGFYNLSFKERSFNSLTHNDNTIVKSSTNSKIKGEIYWYQNIPKTINHLFPTFIESSENCYSIEKIKGIPLSHLYANNCFEFSYLTKLLISINQIHTSLESLPEVNKSICTSLYYPKLIERLNNFDYSGFSKSAEIQHKLITKYCEYTDKKLYKPGVIHGDPVFSNILIDELSQLKFIDMRGTSQEINTIFGDIFYDYAKIYQSLLGYEYILYEKQLNYTYMSVFTEEFKRYFINKFSDELWDYLQWLTIGLYFTLIPLHDEYFRLKLYNHMLYLYDNLL